MSVSDSFAPQSGWQTIRVGPHDLDCRSVVRELTEFALKLTKRDVALAEDLVQDVMEKIVTSGGSYDVATPMPYLRSMIAKRFVDFRRARRDIVVEDSALSAKALASDPVGAVELRLELMAELRRVSPAAASAAALLLDLEHGDFHALDQATVAELLGIEVNAVAQRMRDAKRQLRDLMTLSQEDIA